MARTLVYRITFNDANPEGGYVADDVVDIYYDPANDPVPGTAGLEVEKNGVAVVAGNNISFLAKPYKTVQFFTSSICNGTMSVAFSPATSAFPYLFPVGFPDFPGCAVNPVSCDLIVVGVPEVKGASGLSTSDGEITVEAQSSNPIKYRLNSDFEYNDGTGLASGHFFVVPGTYRVYIRDSKNCFASVALTVGVDNEYNPVLTLEYTDRLMNSTKIEVQKRAYDGETAVVKGGENPFTLSIQGEGEENKFTPVFSTMAQLILASEIDAQFQDIFTNSQKEYRIAYFKDLGLSLPPFIPAALDAIALWAYDSPGWSWTFFSGSWTNTLNQSGVGTANLYTDYDFVPGQTYSFDYQFTTQHNNHAAGYIKIKISNSDNGDLGTELLIPLPNPGTSSPQVHSGNFEFVCPVGASRIQVYCRNTSGNGYTVVYNLDSFDNVTESHDGALIGYELKWVGPVLPQQYAEDYKAPPYLTTIVAKDGLTDLVNIDFLQGDGQPYFGRIRCLTLLSECLKKTLLDLPIRCACNLFAEDMDRGINDDPLDQAYVDPENYYLNDNPTFGFVLEAILRTFRARIVQWDGRWNIVSVEEMVDAYNYRDFNKDGIFTASGTYDPVKNVNVPSTSDRLMWMKSPYLELRPGYGKARVIYHLGLKPNILRNGDFRLKSTYNPLTGSYSYEIDKFGFQLVAPYPISETSVLLEAPNVAYQMSSDLAGTTGEASLMSEVYSVAMGSNNTLKISIRYKVPQPIRYSLAINDGGSLVIVYEPFQLYYQKVRMVVQYGTLYLQTNGSWSAIYSELTFYVTQYGEYADAEIIASQPSPAFTDAHDFSVKVFHSWGNHAEFASVAALKTKITGQGNARGNYDASTNLFPAAGGSGGGGSVVKGNKWRISVPGILGGQPVLVGYTVAALVDAPGQLAANWFVSTSSIGALPTGTKTEINDGFQMTYYELEENTDAYDDVSIVRPADYDAVNNGVQWILKHTGDFDQNPKVVFTIDKIAVEFLTDGKAPLDTIISQLAGEQNNNLVLEEEVFHGSLSSVIQSNIVQGIEVRNIRPGDLINGRLKSIFPRVSDFRVTQNILSGDLIYTGFLSDADGNGFDKWSRSGIDELTQLHTIFLKTVVGQYSGSYRKIRGGLVGDIYLGLTDTIREVQQGSRVYLPMALTINDKEAGYEGEFAELINVFEENVGAGFSIGFSQGFNA